MINNRQNGRRRGRGGQRPGGGAGGGSAVQSGGSRIDNRARGNANQLYEKYKALARDAQMQGDRVNTEYYLQFADHYFRVLSENRPKSDDQRPRQQNDFDDDFDGSDGDDFGMEGEPVRADQYQVRPDRIRDERPREDRQRDERSDRTDRDERRPERGEVARSEPVRGDGNRVERAPRVDRDDRRPRVQPEAPRRDASEANGHAVDPVAILQPDPATEQASAPHLADMEAPQPRRRGRPRREREHETVVVETVEADRLPPSLSLAASAEPDSALADGEPTEKPRRRRRIATPAETTSAE